MKNQDEGSKSSNGNSADTEGDEESEMGGLDKSLDDRRAGVDKLHYQPFTHGQGKNRKHDPNRYRLQFDRESKAEIEARKKAAQEPLKYVTESWTCLNVLLGDIP